MTMPTRTEIAALADPWRLLWNGDLDLIDQVIHPDWLAHAAPITGGAAGEMRGRRSLGEWVTGFRTLFPDTDFSIDVGPIVDGDFLVVRWKARGTYAGGFPTASPDAVGREITLFGTDTLRVKDGQLAEYWANADSLWLMQQLGVDRVPPLD